MNKKNLLIIVIVLLFFVTLTVTKTQTNKMSPSSEANAQDLLFQNAIINTTSKEISGSEISLYQNIIISALSSTITSSINEYYKEKLTFIPHFDYSTTKITYIEERIGDPTSLYTITFEVIPYDEAHTLIGKDQITIQLSSTKLPEVLTFKHLEDYILPNKNYD